MDPLQSILCFLIDLLNDLFPNAADIWEFLGDVVGCETEQEA